MKKRFLPGSMRWLLFLGLVCAVALVAQHAPFAWASPLARPARQTVPPPTPTPTPKPAPPAPPVVPAALLEVTPATSYAGPGEQTEIVFTVHNNTGAAMTNAEITIPEVPDLRWEVVSADQGEVVTGSILWRLGTLQPGQVAHLTLRATMPTAMAPNACFKIEGRLAWSGGGPVQAQALLCAPADILPKTGE